MLNAMKEFVKKAMPEGNRPRRRVSSRFGGDVQNLEGPQLLAAHVLKHGDAGGFFRNVGCDDE